MLAPANLPGMLAGSEQGSFAEYTMRKRLPDIARNLALKGNRPARVREQLLELAEELPNSPIRQLRDEGAPDEMLWREWMAPYLGLNWLETPWFPAETYFFRRILEATGYFQPGETWRVDPYLDQKRESLMEVVKPLKSVSEMLNRGGAEPQAELSWLLHTVIWGNQADLSIWPAGSEPPANHKADDRIAHLLVDHARQTAEFILKSKSGLRVVDIILDNVGLELAYDLVLADMLLKKGWLDGFASMLKFTRPTCPTRRSQTFTRWWKRSSRRMYQR